MSYWSKNSEKNLIELSQEKSSFQKALAEWEFSGFMQDYDDTTEICQLCEQGGLRYHFGIINLKTKSALQVGSSCIAKFDIKVIDEDGEEVISNKDTYLKERVKKKHVLDRLKILEKSTTNLRIGYRTYQELDAFCIDVLRKENKCSPKMLNYLFMRFEKDGIDYNPKHFKLDLRSKANKEQLTGMKPKQFERIRNTLSSGQFIQYQKLKEKRK